MSALESSQITMRRCDIVMKGGVTSGIVYPPAVRELAEAFRFVNIGGTSAGAIAASLTAAAEYRRHNGGGLAGFERLARVPHELSQDDALLGLFAPNRSTALVFNFMMTLIEAKSFGQRLRHIVALPFAGSQRGVAWTIVAAGAGMAAAQLAATPEAWPGAGATVALGLGVAGGVGIFLTMRNAIGAIVANNFGLASGVDETDKKNPKLLGIWLGSLIDEIAGLAPGDHLTFGHLWYGRPPAGIADTERPGDIDEPPADPAQPASSAGTKRNKPIINLEMVSTCISHGRPYTFPSGKNTFYFRPDVLETYIDEDVIAMMIRNKRPEGDTGLTDAEILPYVRMPVDRDLPVVLAARMSLAFPLLLTAVQLGAIDFAKARRAVALGAKPSLPEPCWFADGGLSSNFPIHLFDSPLPRWPTFGVNLGSFLPDESDYDPHDESRNVWMPNSNVGGLAENWSRFTSVPAYLGAMFNGIKDWNDNIQMSMPGFRDRIVTVKLRASEGGLNLKMGPEKIDPLAARGRAAGKRLREQFATASLGRFQKSMDWENHRVVRYRVAMSVLQRFARTFADGYDGRDVQPGDVAYDTLLANAAGPDDNFKAYPWPAHQPVKVRAPSVTKLIARLSAWLDAKRVDFVDGSPNPRPELAKRPRY